MSQLIGTEPTVRVGTKALLEDGGKKITVPFVAVFTRLTRSENKQLKNRLAKTMERLRAIAKELTTIEELGLSDEEREAKENNLNQEIDQLGENVSSEIRTYLKTIEDLKGKNNAVIEYSQELLDDMLNHEAYFIALRDALYRANGAYVDQKAKNS